MHILLLGGTTEASVMASALAGAGVRTVYSYAGRTRTQRLQPLPTRVGGFGGVEGLEAYLKAEQITHVIDATHPFAAGMSRNAHAACEGLGLPLLRLERPAWVAGPDDNWTEVARVEDLPAALPETPARVFLAIGKQQLGLFAACPQHHYLLRLVDPPEAPLPLPNTTVVISKGPFDVAGDRALLEDHGITHIVAKNSGGKGAEAKLIAARALGLPVLLAARPALPVCETAGGVDQAMAWLGLHAERGV